MKRYLFIYGEINGGGAERVLLDILQNFDYSNNSVDLLQINSGGLLIDEVPKEANIISAWNGYPISYKAALRYSLWIGYQALIRHRLMSVIGNKHYDVAISFLEGMPTKCHALITDVADRNYSWVHCDLDKFRYTSDLYRSNEELEAYNSMDAVVSVSKDTADAFARRFPTCKAKSMVVYNPIDKRKILRMAGGKPTDSQDFTISICGRLTPQKKIDRVLRLAKRLKADKRKVKIQLIGDGELREELQSQAKELDVMDIVEFVGFTRNPYPYIKSSQLLLSTSCAEGFSLVICEAMTLGVPVVATKTAGPMEILDDNKYGLLCEHDDESIYNAVCRMMDNDDLRKQYIELGKLRVEKFSITNTMTEIYKL